ncbi:unnamed protein product [Clonostachys rosea f. rosea IK726]|uniref:Ketoreductase (KR) domain-containing protein n=2 Tax=Bionectria ochroleuca TaxID=29856 RepID=A0A0B7KC56_BIOOC|nr:unnamed protein product [Clonostachys rosea f. rosea IK726]
MPATRFDITPEERASPSAFIKRQLFGGAPVTLKANVNLQGQTAVVTGSNTGIGLECARQFLDLGLSRLIIAVRNVPSGEIARKLLLEGRSLSEHHIDVWKVDLSRYGSIQSFVKQCETLDRLDIFVHNAGVSKGRFELNPMTGHEESVQINHLSSALLSILMLPVIKERNPSDRPGKLVIVSSETASWSKFKERETTPLLPTFDKPETFNQGEYGTRYWTSKLLGQFFVTELVKHVPPSAVVINMCNPGMCYGSSLMRDFAGTFSGFMIGIFFRVFGYSPSKGARSLTDAACNHGPKSHGIYIEDGKLQPMAPLIYSSQETQTMEQVWTETLEELKFAGVHEIIKRLGNSDAR